METIALLALAFLISGGQLNEENVQYVTSNEEAVQELYNPSETRLSDIIHTDLAVRFDWEKQHLHGTAEITAKPYFKPTNELVLDAKGFDIHSVKMGEEELSYQYENNKLSILLAKTYGQGDSYTVTIQYTAKPNELNVRVPSHLKRKGSVLYKPPWGRRQASTNLDSGRNRGKLLLVSNH